VICPDCKREMELYDPAVPLAPIYECFHCRCAVIGFPVNDDESTALDEVIKRMTDPEPPHEKATLDELERVCTAVSQAGGKAFVDFTDGPGRVERRGNFLILRRRPRN
jgi:hypothetical protein